MDSWLLFPLNSMHLTFETKPPEHNGECYADSVISVHCRVVHMFLPNVTF